MKWNKRKTASLAIGLAVLVAAGCGNNEGAGEEAELHVAAAADLYDAFSAMEEPFTEETGIDVTFNFGSTGLMTQQIEEGAPVDVFAAAHESYIDRLIEGGHMEEETKAHYANGLIVYLYDEEKYGEMDAETLVEEDVQTIAIANPEHAPYGQAAMESFEAHEVEEEVDEKLVYAENVRQAVQYVETGEADAGVVALALAEETGLGYTLIEDDSHEPIVQAVGIPAQAEYEEEAERFIDFVLSEEGREILEEYGFELP
ncbi:molybdate ABC transporter substrate-binding protein [Salsuginibacillus kocurii]|uniref:molybdate ABC transporter substrate-binding protein n=1 Tax=Salsuginibacillus kocurii TaxID=427078 RepID=UPI00036E8B33|nr:molybdate ABC transporter substrate-binding protein [Salsuginibacillus kocurii]